MVAATFLGTYPRMYPQYLDVDPIPAGTTLVAEPLNTYQLAIADQWDIGDIPGDGLWGEVARGVITFGSTPGLAIIGGMTPGEPSNEEAPTPPDTLTFGATPGLAVIGALSPGFPGLAVSMARLESALAPAPAPVQEIPSTPVVRVVKGRRRKLRPAPARRPGRTRQLTGR